MFLFRHPSTVSVLMSSSLFAEGMKKGFDLTPFVIRMFRDRSSAVQACNSGFRYQANSGRPGFISHPTAKRNDWRVLLTYVVDSKQVYFTHQGNEWFMEHFAVPQFVAPLKKEIQIEDRGLFPNILFDSCYQPPTNGINSIWCSKYDFRLDYISSYKLVPSQFWNDNCSSVPLRIAVVLEEFFSQNGIRFVRTYPYASVQH